MTRTGRFIAAMLVGALAAGPAAGRNFKLVKEGGPDATDIRSLVGSVTRGCATDKAKAVALWAYITRRPYYHWWCMEEPESATEMGYVYDPISRFNVHGAVICFEVTHTLAAMAEVAGLKNRCWGLPGHQVMEMFYGGAWHLFDAQVDCASYFNSDDGGTILDVDTVRNDSVRYILNQQHPSNPFFPYDHYGGKFIPWETKQYCSDNFYNPGQGSVYVANHHWGHSVHTDLRRGEKLIRYWDNQGKWVCTAAMYGRYFAWGAPFYHLERGYHDLRDPKNHFCNGVLIYEPDWAASEDNFLDGLYDGINYVLSDGKVRPASAGESHVIFRVQTPYLLAGKPGELDTDGDSSDGAIFEADLYRKSISETACVAVSTDNGLTWQTVWTHSGTGTQRVKLNLTNEVEGTYGYLIKVRLLADAPADAALSNMKLTNWLFLSPVPLPGVTAGRNRFVFTHKPGHAVFWIRPDMTPGNYARFFHQLTTMSYYDYFPSRLRPTGSGNRGEAVVLVQPPDGWQVRRLTVVGMFGTRNSASSTDLAQVLYRTSPAGKWVYAWKGGFESGAHWRQDRTTDILLPAPAGQCYVKFRLKRASGHCSLNNYRIYAHCTRPEPALPPGRVKVTHAWFADGKARSRSVYPSLEGQTYTVHVSGSTIVNRSLAISVANDPPPEGPAAAGGAGTTGAAEPAVEGPAADEPEARASGGAPGGTRTATATSGAGSTRTKRTADADAPIRSTVDWAAVGESPAAEHIAVCAGEGGAGGRRRRPRLLVREGMMAVMWSDHPRAAGAPGQRVLVSLSRDGRAWSDPVECFPAQDKVRPCGQSGRAVRAAAWAVVDGTAYAVAEVVDQIAGRDARRDGARLARSVGADGRMGPIFWLVEGPPEPVTGFAAYPDPSEERFAALAERIKQALGGPRGMVRADGRALGEPATYRRSDGALVRLWPGGGRLYAAVSGNAGRTWSSPAATSLPAGADGCDAGSLPDGRAFLLGSFSPDRPAALTLAVSRDGSAFDRGAVVRRADAPIGRPSVAVGAGSIWAAYAVGESEIAVTRVPADRPTGRP